MICDDHSEHNTTDPSALRRNDQITAEPRRRGRPRRFRGYAVDDAKIVEAINVLPGHDAARFWRAVSLDGARQTIAALTDLLLEQGRRYAPCHRARLAHADQPQYGKEWRYLPGGLWQVAPKFP